MQCVHSSAALNEAMEKSASIDILLKIRRIAEQRFSGSPGSHDWEHTLRVHRLCRCIGPMEGADMMVLEAAAYLHDIGRSHQDASNGSVCHAVRGAEITRRIIDPLPLTAACKNNIIHSVRAHRFRDGHNPATVEARVLFDADKLDAIGAVGIARAYLFAGELGACLHNPHMPPDEARSYSRNDTGHREYIVKLSKIKDRMLTTEGRRMAQERHTFMTAFFSRFLDEYEGRC